MWLSPLLWRHNGRDAVSDHQPYDCLLNHSFRRRWKKTSKLRVTGLCAVNSPVTDEFPAQRASNADFFFHLMTSSCYAGELTLVNTGKWITRIYPQTVNPLMTWFAACVIEVISVGSGNGVSSIRHHAITQTNAVIWALGTNFGEMSSKYIYFVRKNASSLQNDAYISGIHFVRCWVFHRHRGNHPTLPVKERWLIWSKLKICNVKRIIPP